LARARSFGVSFAVHMTTGMEAVCGFATIMLVVSKPSAPVII